MKKQKVGSDAKTFTVKLFNIFKVILIDWPMIVDPDSIAHTVNTSKSEVYNYYSVTNPTGRALHQVLQEFCILNYILFPRSFLRFIRNQILDTKDIRVNNPSSTSPLVLSAIGETVEFYLQFVKFNTDSLYNFETHELNLDRWKNIDFDKRILDFKLFGTKTTHQDSTLRKAFSPDGDSNNSIEDFDNFSQLEQLLQENRPREFWWQRIMGVQRWIELFFTNEPASSKDKFTSEVTDLHKQLLLVKNELLYEKCLRKELEQHCHKLQSERIQSWKDQASSDALQKKIAQQANDIHRLQEEVQIWKKADREARDRLHHWDTTLQSNLQSANATIKKLTEDYLTHSEKVDALKFQIEELKKESNVKSNRIYELETKVSENNSRMEKLKEQESKMASLMKEVHLWERSHSKLVATMKQNKELSEGIIFRNKIIDGISRKLELAQEKLHEASSLIHTKTEYIKQLKTEVFEANKFVTEWKETLEYHRTVSTEKMKALEQKYDTVKNLNAILQKKITEMRFNMEENNRKGDQFGGSGNQSLQL
jgi:outer membrane murein-binding lipoprotein Lpp